MLPLPDPVEIPLSQRKIILLLAGALLFVILGGWFMLEPARFTDAFSLGKAAVLTIGLMSMLFFGCCAWLLVQKLPDRKPGLIVNRSGLTDYSSGKTPVHIPWADVEDLWVLRIQNKKLIMVQVRNPEHYIAQQRHVLKRKMMQLNHRMYGTPLSITANALKISFDKLWQVLAEQFKETHGL